MRDRYTVWQQGLDSLDFERVRRIPAGRSDQASFCAKMLSELNPHRKVAIWSRNRGCFLKMFIKGERI